MGARRNVELDVFVEDEVAQALIEEALPASTRSRIKITVIGSATAIARQLAALYVRGEERTTIAVFDGDQKTKEAANVKHAKNMVENITATFETWLKDRIAYLPGMTWPEAWIVEKCKANLTASATALSIEDEADANDILEYGLQAGKHNEFHEISKYVGLRKDQVLQRLTSAARATALADFAAIAKSITEKLK